MKVIYKYTLTSGQDTRIELPLNSKILNAELIRGKIVVHVLLPVCSCEDNIKTSYKFRLLWTGEETSDIEHYKYLNTFKDCTDIVWHVFYKSE